MHIDVNKELTSEYLQAIVERIRKEKVSSITIRNNLFKSFNNFAFLITELIQNKNLKTFTFGDNHNTTGFDEGWMLITKLIAENKNLRHLYLSMSFLYDKYLKGIFKEALIGKRIKTLDLSSNFITYPGTRRIAEWLGTNKTLQVLALQQNTMNEFKKEGSDAIVEKLMTHKSITTLDLSNMILTGLGEKMGELIKSSRTLKELRIRGTRMNLDDFKHICLPMCGNELITEINLSENDTRNDKSLEYIAKMIKENKTLKIISLEKLGISNKNCQIIFDAIAQNETIENYSFTYHQKFKISTILDFFKNKSNAKALKVLTISAFDVKKNGEENDLVEKFKAERDDVNVKIS